MISGCLVVLTTLYAICTIPKAPILESREEKISTKSETFLSSFSDQEDNSPIEDKITISILSTNEKNLASQDNIGKN